MHRSKEERPARSRRSVAVKAMERCSCMALARSNRSSTNSILGSTEVLVHLADLCFVDFVLGGKECFKPSPLSRLGPRIYIWGRVKSLGDFNLLLCMLKVFN